MISVKPALTRLLSIARRRVQVLWDIPTRPGSMRRRARSLARNFSRNGKPTAVLVGFSAWKGFMRDYLPDHNVVFLTHQSSISDALIETIELLPRPVVYAWSYRWPPFLKDYCAAKGIELFFVEDGFIRSIGLGIRRSKPVSLCFDRRAMHFDRNRPSELEDLLLTRDFSADEALMSQAAELHGWLVRDGVTKYIYSSVPGHDHQRNEEVVLVLGQVDDDESIRHGMSRVMSSNDLVRRAVAENPGKRIVFRPHPEALAVSRPTLSDPAEVADICEIVPAGESLHQSLARCAKVYTMTSLGGFEAALHGLPVKVFGSPFYAGWGFTEDVEPIARRTRVLSPREVLAGAYLLYPRYFDPLTCQRLDPMSAIIRLRTEIESLRRP